MEDGVHDPAPAIPKNATVAFVALARLFVILMTPFETIDMVNAAGPDEPFVEFNEVNVAVVPIPETENTVVVLVEKNELSILLTVTIPANFPVLLYSVLIGIVKSTVPVEAVTTSLLTDIETAPELYVELKGGANGYDASNALINTDEAS